MSKSPSYHPNRIKQLLGTGLVLVSALGIIASLIGIVYVSSASISLSRTLQNTAILVEEALNATGESLSLAGDALNEATEGMAALQATTRDVSQTVHDTDALLGSLSGVFGTDLPDTIGYSQTALDSAAQGADTIEGMLYAMNAVSFITNKTYNPAEPLGDSINQIKDSLGSLPASFESISENLEITQSNLADTEGNLSDMGDSLASIEQTMGEAQNVLRDYRQIVQALETDISSLRERIPSALSKATLGAYFVLVWLALSQVGLFFQGREMMRDDVRRLEARIAALEK